MDAADVLTALAADPPMTAAQLTRRLRAADTDVYAALAHLDATGEAFMEDCRCGSRKAWRPSPEPVLIARSNQT